MDLGEKKILFLTPYPLDTVGGQRFRFEQYLSFIKEKGFDYKILSFWNLSTFSILYKRGHYFRKISSLFIGFLRRFYHLILAANADYVFIYRELTPIGLPLFEWIISKVLKRKIIYDFDDAIWLENELSHNKVFSILKFSRKVSSICKWSYKISVGNNYLREYAGLYNKNVFIIPTTIDLNYHNEIKNQQTELIVIGWTGTHSTLKYLDLVLKPLQNLQKRFDFEFRVIADTKVDLPLQKFRFIYWNKANEIKDLLEFNIGVMPLPDDKWSRGKCGFKALQYMALGIPPVVSPVGVNADIVKDGLEGFCCTTEIEWEEKLSILFQNLTLRKNMGLASFNKVQNNYSVNAVKSQFLLLFS